MRMGAGEYQAAWPTYRPPIPANPSGTLGVGSRPVKWYPSWHWADPLVSQAILAARRSATVVSLAPVQRLYPSGPSAFSYRPLSSLNAWDGSSKVNRIP